MTKKLIAAFLALMMLVGVAATGLSALAYESENIYAYSIDRTASKISVSKNASYTITLNGTSYVSGYADGSSKLTDGTTSATLSSGYVGVTGTGTVEILVDLGAANAGLADFYVHALNATSSSGALPTAIALAVSDDGTDYKNVTAGTGAIPSNPSSNTAYNIGYAIKEGVLARYVKFTLTLAGTAVYFDEISVYTYGTVQTVSGSDNIDSQGVKYTLTTAGTAYVTGYTDYYETTKETTTTTTGFKACTNNGKSGNSSSYTYYYIGVGSSDYPNGIKVSVLYVPSGRNNRPGVITTKKYVLIHNTGNYASTATALANHNYCRSTSAASTPASWHYTVGKDGIYQSIPDNEKAWHAGDGGAGTYNNYSIGIETCVNGWPNTYSGTSWKNFLTNTFNECCRRAALLTVELLVRHGLKPGDCSPTNGDVRQHYDASKKNCPMQMRYNTSSGSYTRNTGDMWVYYVNYVKKYWTEINGGGSSTSTQTVKTANKVTDVVIPQYVVSNGAYYKVTGISSTAFQNYSLLTSVSLPDTISWGTLTNTFSGSSALKAINVAAENTFISSTAGKLVYSGTTITPAAYNASAAKEVFDPVKLISAPTSSTTTVISSDTIVEESSAAPSTTPSADTSSEAPSTNVKTNYALEGTYMYSTIASSEYTSYLDDKWTGAKDASTGLPELESLGKGDLNDGVLGKTGTPNADQSWVGWIYTDTSKPTEIVIVFDLGAVKTDIGKVNVTLNKYSETATVMPSAITVAYGTDIYANGGTKTGTGSTDDGCVYTFTADLGGVSAKIVKVTVPKVSERLFIGEIEIWNTATGTSTPSEQPSEQPSEESSEAPSVDDGEYFVVKAANKDTVKVDTATNRVLGIGAAKTADEVKALFEDGDKITVTLNSGATKVGTGATLTRGNKTIKVIVLGDVDGDGDILTNDFIMVKAQFFFQNKLANEAFVAGDINGDGAYTTTDYFLLKVKLRGIETPYFK